LSDSIKDAGSQGLLGRLLYGAALTGGLVLFAIMLLVSWAVFARYVLNDPILGDQELVEIGMSVVIMLAMPFVTATNAHIRVDIFDNKLGQSGRFVCDLITRCIGAFILYLLGRKTWSKALDAHEYGDVTNMIELPVWIAYGAITAGMGLFALLLIWQVIDQLRKGPNGYE